MGAIVPIIGAIGAIAGAGMSIFGAMQKDKGPELPAAPALPSYSDAEKAGKDEKRKRLAAQSKTILTSPLGDESTAPTEQTGLKTTLGGR